MLRPEEAAALQTARHPVIAIGDDGLVGYASRSALALVGWSQALVGKPLSALIPERLMPHHKQAYHRFVVTRKQARYEARVQPALAEDGSERPVQVFVGGFRRNDGSLFVCATLAPPGLPGLDLGGIPDALRRYGYVPLNPY
jgi:PAS domain S-box-containing protein